MNDISIFQCSQALDDYLNQMKVYKGKVIRQQMTNKVGRVLEKADYFLKTKNGKHFIKFSETFTEKELLPYVGKTIELKAILTVGLWDTNDPNVQSRMGEYLEVIEMVNPSIAIAMGVTTIIGKAQNAKLGAIILSENPSKVYYIEGLSAWEDDFLGKQVKVTGSLMVEHWGNSQNENGEWKAGGLEEITFLQNADYQLAAIDLTDPTYFDTVVDYIKKYGAIREVELSPKLLGKKTGLLLTYKILDWDGWEITVSEFTPNDRIYMHRKGGVRSNGNFLKENGKVSPEVTSPFKNPKLREKKRVQIIEGYTGLIELALADDKNKADTNLIYTHLDTFVAKHNSLVINELSHEKEKQLIGFIQNNKKTYPSQIELPYSEKWQINMEKTAEWFVFGAFKNPFLAVVNSHQSNFHYRIFMIWKDKNGYYHLYLRRHSDLFIIQILIEDNRKLEEVYKIVFE